VRTASPTLGPDEPFADNSDRWFNTTTGTIHYANPRHQGRPELSPTSAELPDAALLDQLRRAQAADTKLRRDPTRGCARDRYFINKMAWDLFSEARRRELI